MRISHPLLGTDPLLDERHFNASFYYSELWRAHLLYTAGDKHAADTRLAEAHALALRTVYQLRRPFLQRVARGPWLFGPKRRAARKAIENAQHQMRDHLEGDLNTSALLDLLEGQEQLVAPLGPRSRQSSLS